MRLVNDAVLLEKSLNSLCGLCAVLDPGLSLVSVDLNLYGLRDGVVVTDLLDESTVSGATAVCNYYALEGSLLSAHSSKSDFYCHDFFLQ